ncbi:MAG: methyltransferase domain-containing protein [Trueperaceae bacterium]
MEAEVLPGLAHVASAELRATGHAEGTRATSEPATADAVAFRWRGAWEPLRQLRTVTSVQRVVRFDVPRPKALLGDREFRRLHEAVAQIRSGSPTPFRGVRVEAAGRDSPTLQRLRSALSEATGLPDAPDDGDLQIRLRPRRPGTRHDLAGWEALIRLLPRPWSVRSWRVVDRPGGLNACVAAAAWTMIGLHPKQRVLNAMCGGGTLLAERHALGPFGSLVGIDLDAAALEAADANLRAAGLHVRVATADAVEGDADARGSALLVRGDATATPWADGAFDVVVADPPWGDAVRGDAGGDGATVASTHEGLLREASRLLPPGGRLLLVTHALRVLDRALAEHGGDWADRGSIRAFHGGHRPVLRLLERR